jgi:hypothetical protein
LQDVGDLDERKIIGCAHPYDFGLFAGQGVEKCVYSHVLLFGCDEGVIVGAFSGVDGGVGERHFSYRRLPAVQIRTGIRDGAVQLAFEVFDGREVPVPFMQREKNALDNIRGVVRRSCSEECEPEQSLLICVDDLFEFVDFLFQHFTNLN